MLSSSCFSFWRLVLGERMGVFVAGGPEDVVVVVVFASGVAGSAGSSSTEDDGAEAGRGCVASTGVVKRRCRSCIICISSAVWFSRIRSRSGELPTGASVSGGWAHRLGAGGVGGVVVFRFPCSDGKSITVGAKGLACGSGTAATPVTAWRIRRFSACQVGHNGSVISCGPLQEGQQAATLHFALSWSWLPHRPQRGARLHFSSWWV